MCNSLPQFKKLTHLTIDNGSFSRGNAGDSNLSVVSIFTAPNVVKFNLSSTFQLLQNEDGSAARFNDFKATTSTTRATTIVDTDETPVLVSPTNYHSSLSKQQQLKNTAESYCPYLKFIGLCAPAINIKQLLDVYIASFLETLELEINRDVWIRQYDKHDLERFGRLLGLMKKSTLIICNTPEHQNSNLRREESLKNYYVLMEAIAARRNSRLI